MKMHNIKFVQSLNIYYLITGWTLHLNHAIPCGGDVRDPFFFYSLIAIDTYFIGNSCALKCCDFVLSQFRHSLSQTACIIRLDERLSKCHYPAVTNFAPWVLDDGGSSPPKFIGRRNTGNFRWTETHEQVISWRGSVRKYPISIVAYACWWRLK